MERITLYKLVHSYKEKGFKQVQISDLLSITQARVSQILQQKFSVLPKWSGHRVSKLTLEQKELLCVYLDKGGISLWI